MIFSLTSSLLKIKNHLYQQYKIIDAQNINIFFNKRIHRIMKSSKYLSNVYCLVHQYEKLNFICTDIRCPTRGLICQLCKADQELSHSSHLDYVVPFKYFIESLELNIDEVNMDLNPHNESGISQKTQKIKNEILARFYHTIQQMARIAEDFERRIIDDYEKKMDNFKNKSLVKRQVKNCIDKCLLHNIKKDEKFQLMNQIKSIVDQIEIKKIPGQNTLYGIDFKGKTLMAKYLTQLQGIKTYCDRIELIFVKFFGNEQDKQKQSAFLNHLDVMEKHHQVSLKENKTFQNPLQLKNPASPDIKIVEKKNIFEKKFNEKMQKSEDNKQLMAKHKNLMNEISLKVKKAAQKVIFDKPETSKQTPVLINTSTAIDITKAVYPKEITFSDQFKSEHIKLLKNSLGAQKFETLHPNKGFIMISHPLQLCKQITFKVTKLKSDIYFGIANIEDVKSSKYSLFENKLGKGLFLKSAKGKSIGQTLKQQQLTPFNFNQKSLITLTYESKILSLHQVSNKKKKNLFDEQFDILTNIKNHQLSMYSFCAFLEGIGDHIQII